MMKMKECKNGALISGIATQKDIENYLFTVHGIPRKTYRDIVKAGRAANYIYEDLETETHSIVIYLEKGKMFLGTMELEKTKYNGV